LYPIKRFFTGAGLQTTSVRNLRHQLEPNK
jgi:hypothetical protein